MRKFVITLLIILLVIVLAAMFAAYRFTSDTEITADVELEIAEGSSTSSIAAQLEEAGLVQNAEVFKLYAKQKHVDQQFRAGIFTFAAGSWSLGEVCDTLLTGGYSGNEIRVTIIEGLKATEIFQTLVDSGLGTMEGYLDYAANGDFSQYDYIPAQENVVEPGNRLDGFLFPDTYMISADATEEEIIDMLLAQFQTVWEENGLAEKAANSQYSTYELVTMASIVEMETKTDSERPIIAGIFYKRIDNGMVLGSCATVQFLLQEKRSILLNSDLEIDSPYNTYMYTGLPAGPICSPGLASLTAAVEPEESEYLYFRARTDGTSRFSVTLEEHETYHEGDQTE